MSAASLELAVYYRVEEQHKQKISLQKLSHVLLLVQTDDRDHHYSAMLHDLHHLERTTNQQYTWVD